MAKKLHTKEYDEYRTKVIASAKKSHGHFEDADDVDVLILRLSNMVKSSKFLAAVLNLNAAQAQVIARLESANKTLQKRLEGEDVFSNL